jgi:hypothetical protein
MFVIADTSHVFIAGLHTPTDELVKHVVTAATRSAFVGYVGTALHTDASEPPPNIVVGRFG